MAGGFSLIEVLVVLAIVSILFAMGFSSLGQERRSSEVQAEAERLAAVLRLTRNRAMNEQRGYGVAFNIRNGVGTSGAVLNNWDGGHYYRIFSSQRHTRDLPAVHSERSWNGFHVNLPYMIDTLKDCWVSDRYLLPAKSVRFLALSDLDRGPRRHYLHKTWPEEYYDSDPSYPRPWFGYYDQTTGRLHAWGGYDPAKNYSGFYYEGTDGDITDCVNPTDRSYDEDFDWDGKFANVDRNNDGDFDDPYERELDYAIWRKGEGRELVNADWLDAAIVFMPSGEARFLEWNSFRRGFFNKQSDGSGGFSGCYVNGIADRCLPKQTGAWNKSGVVHHLFNSSGLHNARSVEQPESTHFVVHTGGWNITLAADAQIDVNHFNTVDEAIASITTAQSSLLQIQPIEADGSRRT